MERYKVELIGETSLLLHQDNLQWDDMISRWLSDPNNKKKGKAGDDRTPAWKWIGYLYQESAMVVMPSDNLMTVLRQGGVECPTGKGQKTFKSLTQSGLIVDQSSWPILIHGHEIETNNIMELIENEDFHRHEEVVKSLGFELFVKRAKVGNNKHVRVRPRFDSWSCSGSITIIDDKISGKDLETILSFAGIYKGLGDWRPSSPKSPGPWGRFSVKIKKM
jgi:hypothetical protein